VLNRDAGFVRVGQPAEVKFEAYPFTRYGVVHGRVEQISRDAVKDDKQGLVYPARIVLSRYWIMVDGQRKALSTGLAATTEIQTGRRRIAEYLLSPLNRRVKEAGRER
jgi:hemolysin D